MLRPGMRRVTATHQPLKVKLGRLGATAYKVQRKLHSAWGGRGKHPTKNPALTVATPINFSLRLPALHPRATSKVERVPQPKDPGLPEPGEGGSGA